MKLDPSGYGASHPLGLSREGLMSSWWRKIAEAQGATHASSGSWKRRVAVQLLQNGSPTAGIAAGQRGSWPRIIAKSGFTSAKRTRGASWTRILTPEGEQASSWKRALFEANGPTV